MREIRAEAARITWPPGAERDDDRLEAALFGGPPHSRPTVLPMPDFAERRPSFPKAIKIEMPPACAGGSSFTARVSTARVSLPADLDTASNSAATTGTSAATVRDKLYPKGAFSVVVRGAAGAAQCIHAGLCRARGCGGVSR